MAKTIADKLNNEIIERNAFRDHNWEVLGVTGFIFVESIGLTLWMVIVSVGDNVFRIIPAAALLVMVGLWITFTLPVYSKLTFWGTLIFIATYLFFGVPFVALGLLPAELTVVSVALIGLSLASCWLLFRQKNRFLKPTAKSPKR